MSEIDKILYATIITYVLIMTIIMVVRPVCLYDNDKHEFKKFGFGENETIFALPVVGSVSCIIIYIIIAIYRFILIKLK